MAWRLPEGSRYAMSSEEVRGVLGYVSGGCADLALEGLEMVIYTQTCLLSCGLSFQPETPTTLT